MSLLLVLLFSGVSLTYASLLLLEASSVHISYYLKGFISTLVSIFLLESFQNAVNTPCPVRPIDIYHTTIPRCQTQNESTSALP